MRIAMVGPFGFHPNKTMRSRALGLARPLVESGHVVKLFMPPWHTPEEAGRSWQEDGVALRYTPLSGGLPGIFRSLLSETLAWKPEVVHAFKPKAYSGLIAWWLWHFRRKSIRLVTDADDWEGRGGWNERATYSPLQKRFFAWQEKWGFRHCHRLTVASRALQSLAWASGVSPEKVIYLPNGPGIRKPAGQDLDTGVDLGLNGRPVLLLYSRLFEFDVRRLVDIIGRVKENTPDLVVLWVGGGLFEQESRSFKDQMKAAGLEDILVETGWVDEDDLPAVLSSAGVGLYLMDDNLLNRTKCPVKLADMLLAGVPVVGEAVGQVPEYVKNGESGLLRASGDHAGLAADVIQLLNNRAEQERLAAGAKVHIQANFSWEKLAMTAERAYR